MWLWSARMEGNIDKTSESVCNYNKYGYCKFQVKCKRLYFKETCENNAPCTNIKNYLKRHTKVCKLYDLDKSCRFGSDRSYLHTKSKKESQNYEKLEYLECGQNFVCPKTLWESISTENIRCEKLIMTKSVPFVAWYSLQKKPCKFILGKVIWTQ